MIPTAKELTAAVMESIGFEHRSIAIHEAGHVVVGYALGLDIADGLASWPTGGFVRYGISGATKTVLADDRHPHRLQILQRIFKAQIAGAIAGAMAVSLHVAKGGDASTLWAGEPSAGDIQSITQALKWLENLGAGDGATLIGAAGDQARDILVSRWPAVLGCADRLQQGKSIWNLNTYLTFMVPRSAI